MPNLEFCLVLLTLVGLVFGAWGIWWARVGEASERATWGRAIFLGTLFALSALSSVAALFHAEGLPAVGLAAGLLVVAMLWEGPYPVCTHPATLDKKGKPAVG